jgi:hypothetical protein
MLAKRGEKKERVAVVRWLSWRMPYLAMFEFGEILYPGGNAPVNEPLLEGALPRLASCDLHGPKFTVFLLQFDEHLDRVTPHLLFC